MVKRGRAITITVAVLVMLLFLGRRFSIILSDQWWASLISADAAAFLFQMHLLRLVLDGAGILVACAWFIGNLFFVYRALSVVQVPRYISNLEFREALSSQDLLAITIALGAILGLLAGLGVSDWWTTMALAWGGVQYEVADPLLGHDLGIYVAQLPWWRAMRSFSLLLSVTGLGVVIILYAVIGSVRWVDGRPAVSDHARAHLGALLAALALCLAWGYLLLPYEIVAGLHGTETAGAWSVRVASTQTLAGIASATAILSLLWAFRPRHALALAGWIILIAGSIIGRFIVPAVSTDDRPAVAANLSETFERTAFALENLELRDRTDQPGRAPAQPPGVPWSAQAIGRLVAVDSTTLLATAPIVLAQAGVPRPVWLTVQETRGEVSVSAIAADRTSAGGGPLSYAAGDTVAYPSVLTLALLDSTEGTIWPGAPDYHVGLGDAGFMLDSWTRRLILAWGLQVGDLLGGTPPTARLTWHRDPIVRATRLAPFATWRDVQPAWRDGRLTWLVTGYVLSETFPAVAPVEWGGGSGSANLVRPGFLTTIDAAGGETHLYLLPEAGPVAGSWSDLAGPVVEPTDAIPNDLLRQLRYPLSQARVHAEVLARRPELGSPVRGGNGVGVGGRSGPIQVGWIAPRTPGVTVAYHRPSSRRLSGLLVGTLVDGRPALELVRIDSVASLPTPAVLHQRWSRFPLHEQIRDSIRADGARLEAGSVQYFLTPTGLIAMGPYYAVRDGTRPRVAWYSLGAVGRLGAGRNPEEAWRNLTGQGVPLPPGMGSVGRFVEAQRWMSLADSALRTGDWVTFGRAFEALREALQIEPD